MIRDLNVDETCMLVIRGAGPVALSRIGRSCEHDPARLPRQERCTNAAVHGRRPAERHIRQAFHSQRVTGVRCGRNLGILQDGDQVKVDLKNRRVDVLISDEEIAAR